MSTPRSIYILALLAAVLLPCQTHAAIVSYDDPARWGAAAQFFTTENFDGVTPAVLSVSDVSRGAGEFVLTDFDIQTPRTDFRWSIDPNGFFAHIDGVFRCNFEFGACYFDIIFDRPISAIGLYLEGITRGSSAIPAGEEGSLLVGPFGIDVFVGASDLPIGPGFYPPDTQPFFKPDTDPFLGLVSDAAFSQIHFVLHDVRHPDFGFLDRFENAVLSRVDYRFAVPEPASLALLGIALAGMGLARRAAF